MKEMKVFKDILMYKGCKVKCVLSQYIYDDSKALFLIDKEDNTPVATCTSCLGEDNKTSFVAIKNYSENEGMLDFLIDNDVVTYCGIDIPCGFTEFPLVIINESNFKYE